MQYRKLPRGDEMISIIGLGNSSMGASGAKETEATVALALENGVNYFDMAAADAVPFAAFGRAVGSQRGRVCYQVHFGATYDSEGGMYGWTLDLDEIKRSVDWQLSRLKTDYIDFGFIHCIDEDSDLASAKDGGTIDYLLSLKRQGVVRHIGMSTHTPETAHAALDLGILDMLMFSINPAYDYVRGEYGIGTVAGRMELYRRCEAEGVGISVMKAFSGGQLLDEKTSPLGCALTEYQCIQYALDKPGVLTVLPGVRGSEDLRRLLGFLDAPASARDYAGIAARAPREIGCVYCNHCAPCPAGLDVGLINKYYDLSRAGDALARDHYAHLARHASDCVGCGHCDGRCPFRVPQSQRMREIAAYFGN